MRQQTCDSVSPLIFDPALAGCKLMFRTEMLESGAAPARCSVGCSEMLAVRGGVHGETHRSLRGLWRAIACCDQNIGLGFLGGHSYWLGSRFCKLLRLSKPALDLMRDEIGSYR